MWATSTVFEVGDVVEAPSNPLEGDVYEGDVVGAKRVTVLGEGDSTRWVIVSTEANGELSFEDGAVPISLEEDTLWYLIPAAE